MAEKDKSLKPAAGGKMLFLRPETYEKMRRLLRFADLFPDPTQFDVVQIGGRKQFRYRGGEAGESGPSLGGGPSVSAFYRIILVDGDSKLQGGQVMGGEGNEAVDDIALTERADGVHEWLEITGDGTVTDDILYAGYKVTSVSHGHGSTLPSNTLPTKDNRTGRKCYVLLGTWNDDVFTPSSAGNVSVTFCPGTGYGITRF